MKIYVLKACGLEYEQFDIPITKDDIGDIYNNDTYYSIYLKLENWEQTYGYINTLMSINTCLSSSASKYFLYFDMNAKEKDELDITLNWSCYEYDSSKPIWCELTDEERFMLVNVACESDNENDS
jgi:hypothetical protein